MKTRSRPRSGTEQPSSPFFPSFGHACLLTCVQKTTTKKKESLLPAHPPRKKNTPLCARSDPPPLPHVRSRSRMFRVHLPTCVHTPTHTHTNTEAKKKKRNTCQKNTCFISWFLIFWLVETRRRPSEVQQWIPLHPLFSSCSLALRRRGTSAVHVHDFWSGAALPAPARKWPPLGKVTERTPVSYSSLSEGPSAVYMPC